MISANQGPGKHDVKGHGQGATVSGIHFLLRLMRHGDAQSPKVDCGGGIRREETGNAFNFGVVLTLQHGNGETASTTIAINLKRKNIEARRRKEANSDSLPWIIFLRHRRLLTLDALDCCLIARISQNFENMPHQRKFTPPSPPNTTTERLGRTGTATLCRCWAFFSGPSNFFFPSPSLSLQSSTGDFQALFLPPSPLARTRHGKTLFRAPTTDKARSCDPADPLSSFTLHPPLPVSIHHTSLNMAPSSSKEKRLAKKAAEGKIKGAKASKLLKKTEEVELDAHGNPIVDDAPATSGEKLDEVKRLTDQMDKHGISDRVTTGVLSSTYTSKDVKITSTSLVFHGRVLITDSTLELSYGKRYGLLGENGCGKSTFLKAIAAREYPIPEHLDIYLLNEGAPPSDLGALEWVVKEAETELKRLDALAEKLLEDEGPESPVLMDLYDVSLTPILYTTNPC